MADATAMGATAAEIGTWDVYIMSAGYVPDKTTIRDADIDDYWKAFEVLLSSPHPLSS